MASAEGLAHRTGTRTPRTPRENLLPSHFDPEDTTKTPASLGSKLYARAWLQAALFLVCLAVVFIVLNFSVHGRPIVDATTAVTAADNPYGPVLVSYSYFEKDPVQKRNAEFFYATGMGLDAKGVPPLDTDFVVVISGDICTPCGVLYPLVTDEKRIAHVPEIKQAAVGQGLTILWRRENEGMDFAAHNVTMEWTRHNKSYYRYKYFILLNSSVRGPFFPSYMPQGWQWTRAYTDRLVGDIVVCSSSIVCLPELDAGGYGAKLESWAFAVLPHALDKLTEAGVFNLRVCKLCDDGVVVMGEYGLTKILMEKHGYNVATLMSMYPRDIDWRDKRHWNCNSNVHPSRHGTYDGIAMHPFEVVFLKASWHVGEPFVRHYTDWFTKQTAGIDTTAGSFDEPMYRYGIQPEAQEPEEVENCFLVGPRKGTVITKR